MIELRIPGFNDLRLRHLVLDYNGTLAVDGKMLDGVKERLNALSHSLEIHILTADTFGTAQQQIAGIRCKLSILPIDNQDKEKLYYVEGLGADQTVCIGNGRNDRLMLQKAALGIAVILSEGAAADAMATADIVTLNINTALDLLTNPLRLKATLRL